MIFCSATAIDRASEAYFLFKSIRRLYPDIECRFDALDFDDANIRLLESLDVIVKGYRTKEPLPSVFGDRSVRQKICHKKKTAHDPRSLLCAAWKIHQFPRIRKETGDRLMWFDSDCLLRSNIDELLKKSKDYDLSIVQRPRSEDHAKVLSSLLIVNSDEGGNRFLDHLQDHYRKEWANAFWWADQLCVYLASVSAKSKVFPIKLGVYNDNKLNSDSKIWHCKHNGKHRKSWINECKKFGGDYEESLRKFQ